MSQLVNAALGPTVDFWWDRLRGQRGRLRFILTKMIEERAYRQVAGGADRPADDVSRTAAVPPRMLRNGIGLNSAATVVVPVLATASEDLSRLHRLIERLHANTPMPSIVVVDDASPKPVVWDGVRVIRNTSRQGPAASRNTGIACALREGAKVIFMTDADCVPESDWVREGLAAFVANPYAHILSGSTASYGTTWCDRYHEINGTLNGRRFRETGNLLYGPTCNMAVTRQVAEQMPFDESFPAAACEDIEFCCRASDQGFLVLHCGEMRVRHDYGYRPWRPLTNLRMLATQFRRYAGSEERLLRCVPDYFDRMSKTDAIPSGGARLRDREDFGKQRLGAPCRLRRLSVHKGL